VIISELLQRVDHKNLSKKWKRVEIKLIQSLDNLVLDSTLHLSCLTMLKLSQRRILKMLSGGFQMVLVNMKFNQQIILVLIEEPKLLLSSEEMQDNFVKNLKSRKF